MLLGGNAEEDGLIALLGLVLVSHQILGADCLLLLLVLLHMCNERIRRSLDLRRVQLVWSLILLLGGKRRLRLLLDLLCDLLRSGHCCGVSFGKVRTSNLAAADQGLVARTFQLFRGAGKTLDAVLHFSGAGLWLLDQVMYLANQRVGTSSA